MNISQLLDGLAERVSASAAVKNVYGDPVVIGARTVIPVAQVRYGFGGGGRPNNGDILSGGGGGSAKARPCGALEITAEGTRFVPFGDSRSVGAAFALGFLVGAAVLALAAKPEAR